MEQGAESKIPPASPPFSKGVWTGVKGNKCTGDMGYTLGVNVQIDGSDFMIAEHQVKHPIDCRREQSYGIAAESSI